MVNTYLRTSLYNFKILMLEPSFGYKLQLLHSIISYNCFRILFKSASIISLEKIIEIPINFMNIFLVFYLVLGNRSVFLPTTLQEFKADIVLTSFFSNYTILDYHSSFASVTVITVTLKLPHLMALHKGTVLFPLMFTDVIFILFAHSSSSPRI